MSRVYVPDDGGDTMVMVDVGGYKTPFFPGKDDDTRKRLFDEIPNFNMRDDDIMMCSFPKTGTNWLFEILTMMIRGSAERVDLVKDLTMMEARTVEEMENIPSPRIINCHVNLRYRSNHPKIFGAVDLKKKNVKTILIVRNPKHTAVSYYNHMKGMTSYQYEGQWKNWLMPHLNGRYEYGKYTDYLREWQEALDNGPGFPLRVVYYEDLKLNCEKEIGRLATFLGLNLSEELVQAIAEACDFDKMQKEKLQEDNGLIDSISKQGFNFFRKGQIGDWKNWFTVRQNEVFDGIWEEESRGLKFPFTYTDPRV